MVEFNRIPDLRNLPWFILELVVFGLALGVLAGGFAVWLVMKLN